MLPEIAYVRRNTTSITTPKDLHRMFPTKSEPTIRKTLRRAIQKGHIIQVGFGEYAHPKYVSPRPKPTESEPKIDWKTTRHASLIYCVIAGLIQDNDNHNSANWLGFIRDLFLIMRDNFTDHAIKEFSKLLSEAINELNVQNYTNMSARQWIEAIKRP